MKSIYFKNALLDISVRKLDELSAEIQTHRKQGPMAVVCNSAFRLAWPTTLGLALWASAAISITCNFCLPNFSLFHLIIFFFNQSRPFSLTWPP